MPLPDTKSNLKTKLGASLTGLSSEVAYLASGWLSFSGLWRLCFTLERSHVADVLEQEIHVELISIQGARGSGR